MGVRIPIRNSRVIHAGLYYPPARSRPISAWKAANACTPGAPATASATGASASCWWRWRKTSARSSRSLAANARACGVDDLMPLDGTTLRAGAPGPRGRRLLSPSTGIIDSHAYLQSLQAVAERHGAQLALDTRVDRLERHAGGWRAEGQSVGEAFRLRAGWVVNAGGLFAQALAQRTEGLDPRLVPALHLCQGRYFSYSGRSPFRHLVYPMPEARTAGLGIHATLDLGGQLRFGPDVNYVDNLDYRVDESLGPAFAQAISRYFPGIDPRRLAAGYAGHPAQLGGPGEPAADFIIQTPARARPARPGQPVRHRVARPHRQPGARRTGSPEHSETRFRRAQGRPGKTALLYSPAHSPLPAQRIRP
ncbi:FAD-dependent oxidoreductase [Pseudomonas aeruginosa]|nr:FAD-dependent oxidoreductase [Pseudomonas aeruginosa]